MEKRPQLCLVYKLFSVLDGFIGIFVLSFFNILHWQGTWNLQEVYILPHQPLKSYGISLFIGVHGCIVLNLIQPSLNNAIRPLRKISIAGYIFYVVITRLYMYVFAAFTMFYWRGLWDFMDYYLSEHWLNNLITAAACQMLCIGLRTCRNQVGVPLSITLDTDTDVYEKDTRYKTEVSDGWYFVMDVVFTQAVVISSSIIIWRGIWNILNLIYAENPFWNDMSCIAIGVAILGLQMMLTMPCAAVSQKAEKKGLIWLLIWEDFLMIVGTIGVVALWNGGESLWELEVFRGRALGSWLSHLLGTIGMIATQTFSNVGTNGIDIDGSFEDGSGIYNTNYLRHYCRHWFKPVCIEDEATERENLL